ncbi:type I-E CRISPR-associated protein Cse1/CasA [Haloglycomyces albus]|uniref:type I-E CRISPR-associated protein Cse1/CasA n=1 Tax=Haloglycomyces albus TaxID=526067 RepID=UPI0004B94D99|nr:type I-E CRISPR-associated protein Cse1/CasA [Haloglycomyces albus]
MTNREPPSGPTDCTYNLLDRPALSVAYVSGYTAEVPIPEAFLAADELTDLVVPVPTMTPALFRQILLPIFWSALGFPRDTDEWAERFEQGRLSEVERRRLIDYFEKYHDRFDLMDPHRPFGQAPGLSSPSGEKPTSLLLSHIATGNNVPLFTPFTDDTGPGLTPMEALAAMANCQCWDTAALKSGAVGDPEVTGGTTKGNPKGVLGELGVVMPLGRTLYDTLMLNTPVRYQGRSEDDRPHWEVDEAPGPVWAKRTAKGPLDLMTWQGRRIRLVTESISGDPTATGVVCTAGDRLSIIPEWEPHTLWHRAKGTKDSPGRMVPKRHQSGKAAWRSLDALLAVPRPSNSKDIATSDLLQGIADYLADDVIAADYPLRVAVFGLEYGTQSAVVENAITDEVPIPVAALMEHDSPVKQFVLDMADQAERLRKAINNYQNNLRNAAGGSALDWDRGAHVGSELIAALDGPARRLLAEIQAAGQNQELLRAAKANWECIAWDQTDRLRKSLAFSIPPEAIIDASGGDNTTVRTVNRANHYLVAAMCKALPEEHERRKRNAERNETNDA